MKPGISNRKSADEERQERRTHPPLDPTSPEPPGGSPRNESDDVADGSQTSHKAGSRSVAQKEAGARYPDRAAPPSKKVAGAFGEEPGGPSARDIDKSSHPNRR